MKSIAVIPKSTTQVFWKAVEAGAREGAKEADVEMVWKGSLNEDDPRSRSKSLSNSFPRAWAALFWRRLMTKRSSAQSPLPCRKESLS